MKDIKIFLGREKFDIDRGAGEFAEGAVGAFHLFFGLSTSQARSCYEGPPIPAPDKVLDQAREPPPGSRKEGLLR